MIQTVPFVLIVVAQMSLPFLQSCPRKNVLIHDSSKKKTFVIWRRAEPFMKAGHAISQRHMLQRETVKRRGPENVLDSVHSFFHFHH